MDSKILNQNINFLNNLKVDTYLYDSLYTCPYEQTNKQPKELIKQCESRLTQPVVY